MWYFVEKESVELRCRLFYVPVGYDSRLLKLYGVKKLHIQVQVNK